MVLLLQGIPLVFLGHSISMEQNTTHQLVGPVPRVTQSCLTMLCFVYLEGIVPTIEEYSGSNGVPDVNGTRLGFCGGNVTVNTISIPSKHTHVSAPQGFSTNYSMWQQGLTADVICGPINSSQTQYVWDTSNSSVIYTTSDTSATSITGLRLWNISANCGISKLVSRVMVSN